MKYEIVMIDADETLFDYNKCEAAALETTLNSFFLGCDYKVLLNEYREINKQIWTEHREGQITKQLLRIERFKRFFSKFNLNADAEKFSEAYLKNLATGNQLIDGAEDVCRYLKSKYRTVIVTNGMKEVQIPRIQKSVINSDIDHIVISEEVGYHKPHVGIFEHVFSLLDHKDKETAIMIGDSLATDIQGGVNFGIDTCWFNCDKQVNDTSLKPTHEIHKLRELIGLL